MIPIKLIEERSLENSKLHYIMAFSEELHRDADMDFQSGVKFAEEELINLAIEFGNWLAKNERCGDERISDKKLGFSIEDHDSYIDFKTTEELFNQFLKEKI